MSNRGLSPVLRAHGELTRTAVLRLDGHPRSSGRHREPPALQCTSHFVPGAFIQHFGSTATSQRAGSTGPAGSCQLSENGLGRLAGLNLLKGWRWGGPTGGETSENGPRPADCPGVTRPILQVVSGSWGPSCRNCSALDSPTRDPPSPVALALLTSCTQLSGSFLLPKG